jgi:acetyltransferase EpsM
MYLYGASGHAKVILDILKDQGIPIDGLFDDDISLHKLCGIQVINGIEGSLEAPLIISIGENAHRARLAKALNVVFGTAIHSSAIVSPTASIGKGSVIIQGCIIQAEAIIGNHVIINTGASVGHECIVHDFVHVSPHATLCGNVKVGEGTHIGAGAVVIPNITIGKWCKIGAGAVVIRDVPDNSMLVGNPGRILLNNVEVMQNLNPRS